ncbi:16S rRNA (guanine(527)-N(7))-methyltransferase RsmG [Chloroflexota bacterium]
MITMEKLIAGAKKLGLQLNSKQLEQFEVYYQKLISWNRRMNLTRITNYEEVQVKHFLDSLTLTLALKQPAGSEGLRIIDVGTGAGIPGLPLKILLPEIRLVLLDATAKKATFLNHIKDKLGLENVEIVVGRAEEVAHSSEYRETFDAVLSRAVASLATLVELTLPFCAIGGSFITQKKGLIELEVGQSTRAISVLGGNLREVKRIELEEFTDERQLIIIDKVSATPTQYPRHPGIPAKRPLV